LNNFIKNIFDAGTIKIAILCILIALPLGFFFAKGGLISVLIALIIILALIYLVYAFKYPKIPLKTAFIVSFFAIGLTRYVGGPFGLTIDILIVLSWISLLVNRWNKMDFSKANSLINLFPVIWFSYIILELFNPQTLSAEAWFYAMRAIALYMFLIFPLCFLLFNSKADLKWMIKIWLLISVLAAIKGITQKMGYLDPFDKAWLNQGDNMRTHVLFGQLRVFSFYSDAGQFGAAMAHAALFSMIMIAEPNKFMVKMMYLALAILFFYAYLISGTRGAFAVIGAGIITYLILSKNFKTLIIGVVLIGSAYYLLAFTNVGQNNYDIRRLRTAFVQGSDEASFQVRIQNQKKLKAYLVDKPFGGGIGTAGDWGRRFSPDSFLAHFETDSLYVRIWAETGVVGLTIYLLFFFYILVKGGLILWKIKDPQYRTKLIALYCGVVGIMAASYGNSVLTQFPSAIVCYFSIAIIFISEKLWYKASSK
jgi:hypothetical protein